ncbi:hypothetical protein HON71_05610 [Candidatus Woesearchaeota archaeon]|jgi:hypothetical protein|nr:hypothetical protein [Candidatus Woesearchaeota archaeon]MBT5342702.1 hypothetical protein [Candidatus Woesearchaeota archaeon]
MGVSYDENGNPIRKVIRVQKYSKYNPAPIDSKEFEKMVKEKCTIPTKSGIKVQSFGEKKIADFLWSNNVDFEYDVLVEFGKEETPDYVQRARPDFLIKGTKIYIEYWGMKYGNSNKPDYDERAKIKIALYQQEGIKLIQVFGEDLQIFGCSILREDLIKANVIKN